MGKTLFVGNLAYSVTDSQLKELFKRHGLVKSVRIISDRTTGRSRGYGFVEMGSDLEALSAAEAMNRIELAGRSLVVSEVHPKTRTMTESESRPSKARGTIRE